MAISCPHKPKSLVPVASQLWLAHSAKVGSGWELWTARKEVGYVTQGYTEKKFIPHKPFPSLPTWGWGSWLDVYSPGLGSFTFKRETTWFTSQCFCKDWMHPVQGLAQNTSSREASVLLSLLIFLKVSVMGWIVTPPPTPNSYVEVLIPSTSQCHCIWR